MYWANLAKIVASPELQAELLGSGRGFITHRGSGKFWDYWNPVLLSLIREELREPQERDEEEIVRLRQEMRMGVGSRSPLTSLGVLICEDVFEEMDVNRNGILEPGEQTKAKKKLHSMMPPQVRFTWSDIDADGDGDITKDEWQSAT